MHLFSALGGARTDERGSARVALLLIVAGMALLGLAGGFGVTLMEILDRVTGALPA